MNITEPWSDGVDRTPIESAMNGSFIEDSASLAPNDLFLSNNATGGFNFTNHTGPLPSTTAAPDAGENILIWGMSSLIFFIFCGFTRRGPDPTHRAFISRRELRRNEVKKDPEWRQKVIANSLIMKRVLSCDENKTLRLGEIEGSISLGGSSFSLNSMEDENVSQCVICLESFQRGDYVTWAKSMECLHVFHQECLEEWLINCKHDGCPSCRAQIINYEEGVNNSSPGDSSSLDGSSDEPSSLAFVIMNGLISPLRRARNSIVGSSINLNNDLDDSSIGSYHNPLSLRRVFSAGATGGSPVTEDHPGLLGVALRRVSSGIYSRLGGTFDAQDEYDEHDAETLEMKDLKQPHMLRRTRSEGLPVTPRTNNSSASYLVLGGPNNDLENPDIHLDFDLDVSSSSFECDSPSRIRGIRRLGMRRPKYDQLRSFREECSSDEESLEPHILWRDEIDDDDDIEAGGIEMSPCRLPILPT